jgi:NADPH:quinone reductase-like Zn-dependent oxidoreductase
MDLIIDPLGPEHWRKEYAALAPGGRLGLFGASSMTELTTGSMFWKIIGYVSLALSRSSRLVEESSNTTSQIKQVIFNSPQQ